MRGIEKGHALERKIRILSHCLPNDESAHAEANRIEGAVQGPEIGGETGSKHLESKSAAAVIAPDLTRPYVCFDLLTESAPSGMPTPDAVHDESGDDGGDHGFWIVRAGDGIWVGVHGGAGTQ